MSADFHNSRTVKATRKTHVCEQCNKAIDVGSSAIHSTGKWEGDLYSVYTHSECDDAAREYATLNNMWGEDWPWFQHMEDSEYEHHAWLLEKHPVVAARLNIEAPVRENA